MKNFNYDNLWKLLELGFSIEELKDFCLTKSFERFRLREVPNESYKRELLTYAERHMVVDDLLNWVKQINPNRYYYHRPYVIEEADKDVAESFKLIGEWLLHFFRLEVENPELAIYISKHSTATHLPFIRVPQNDPALSPALKRINEFQLAEASQLAGEHQIDLKEFTVVSAIELIEASRLLREIDQSNLLSLFSARDQRLLPNHIRTKLDVCPDEGVEKLHEGSRTTVFIGGPRANLGTYYYLFGEHAGEMRPQIRACVVESILDPDIIITCDPSKNLGVIQRYHIQGKSRTIIYLAGTGVNGTAAAVAYLRLHWIELLEEFGDNDFCRVIEVDRRKGDDIPKYIAGEWTDYNWVVRK